MQFNKIFKAILLTFLLFSAGSIYAQTKYRLELAEVKHKYVIGKETKGAEKIQFGFEGGTAVKVHGVYYIFTTEIFDVPKTAAVRLALWKSSNGKNFKRIYQLAETNYNWNDTTSNLMSPWSPMLVFDTAANRWSVFHVGYKRKPGSPDVYNMSGRIRRYDAVKKGLNGIVGPYKIGGWLNIAEKGPAWEGSAGALSFYPYKIKSKWYGLLGTNTVPVMQDPSGDGGAIASTKTYFRASLVEAAQLTGRWERVDSLNPVLFDPEFIENSIVTKIDDTLYICVYDGANKTEMSYAVSSDGIHWGKEQLLTIPDAPGWLHTMRTPLGMIDEGKGIYSIYFTAFDGNNPRKILPLWHNGYGNIGLMKVKLVKD